MRKINEIIVHCAATRSDWWSGKRTSEKVAEVKRWHKARGFRTIGYHYMIDRDGTIAKGRPISETGAHVKGHNTGSIGISLFGGHGSSENDKFEENFTKEQDLALRKLIQTLKAQYQIKKVSGHNEYAAKACPGFKVGPWLNREAPRSIAKSKTVIGGSVAGAGEVGDQLTKMAADTQLAAEKLQPLVQNAELIQWAFTGLTLAGVAFVLWARYNDWKKGRK